jgi:rhamnosyl/mannosyltransferase
MRILHIYKDYHPVLGGIENHIGTLAELEAGAGHEVTVLVTNPGGQPARETRNGVRLIRLPRIATLASAPLTFGFPRAIRRQRPDITHLHFPYPVGEVGQMRGGRGRPYVITYHSDIVRQKTLLRLYAPLLRRLLRNAARILPTSQNYLNTSPWLQPFADKCTVVPLSVDPAPFANPVPLIPPDGRPTLLFVGRHRHYKGVDDLIRALPGINARVLIGGDGPLRSQWEELARRLGLAAQIQFVGEVSDADLPGLFASADIFVLPANSRAEAFGKVLLEAMVAGLPCITTEVGTGTSFVVQGGVSGVVVPPRDPRALREGIESLLGDADKRREMGAAGRARVLREFTEEMLLTRVIGVYEAVRNKNS